MDQAAQALNEAEEAEDFQAVGMRLREGLLTFLRGVVSDAYLPTGEAQPPAGDFPRWADIIANAVAAGRSKAELRRHLKAAAHTTWAMLNWLTHAQNASRGQAFIALTACDHLAGAFLAAIADHERGEPLRCPVCGSYQLKTFTGDDVLDRTVCVVCLAEV